MSNGVKSVRKKGVGEEEAKSIAISTFEKYQIKTDPEVNRIVEDFARQHAKENRGSVEEAAKALARETVYKQVKSETAEWASARRGRVLKTEPATREEIDMLARALKGKKQEPYRLETITVEAEAPKTELAKKMPTPKPDAGKKIAELKAAAAKRKEEAAGARAAKKEELAAKAAERKAAAQKKEAARLAKLEERKVKRKEAVEAAKAKLEERRSERIAKVEKENAAAAEKAAAAKAKRAEAKAEAVAAKRAAEIARLAAKATAPTPKPEKAKPAPTAVAFAPKVETETARGRALLGMMGSTGIEERRVGLPSGRTPTAKAAAVTAESTYNLALSAGNAVTSLKRGGLRRDRVEDNEGTLNNFLAQYEKMSEGERKKLDDMIRETSREITTYRNASEIARAAREQLGKA